MCLPPLISHFLEIPVFANPNFPLPTGDSIKNTFYSLQTNSCTSPYTAKSYSLTWFRRQNKHYAFVSKGKSWSSKPICHWLYSETHLMANSSLHLHNHVRCTPRARCSSRHTDLPTYLLQYTNAIFCPVIQFFFLKKKKEKTQGTTLRPLIQQQSHQYFNSHFKQKQSQA